MLTCKIIELSFLNIESPDVGGFDFKSHPRFSGGLQ